jgi:cobalamin-dependent methionine synthase I
MQKSKEYDVDVIGLSGLITPSLDEMLDMAREMLKAGFKQPLLIGGATASKMHTAVKITPNFFTTQHPVSHLLDSSHFVTVVSSLLGANKEEYIKDLKEEYDKAKKLFDDAQVMMKQIIADGSMMLKGVVGLFPANCSDDGEDVGIFETEADREAGKTAGKFCMLRQTG